MGRGGPSGRRRDRQPPAVLRRGDRGRQTGDRRGLHDLHSAGAFLERDRDHVRSSDRVSAGSRSRPP